MLNINQFIYLYIIYMLVNFQEQPKLCFNANRWLVVLSA